MSRPIKCRRIRFAPEVMCFKPASIPGRDLEEVPLTIDELEAIRLGDFEGLYQEDAAAEMGISRQTFGNILMSAHRKIADCVINGKMLRIEGGVIKMAEERSFTCFDCKHEWSVPFGTSRPSECPSCRSTNVHRSESDRGQRRRRRGGNYKQQR